MSKYLRDEQLRNLTITEKQLRAFNDDIQDVITKANNALQTSRSGQNITDGLLFCRFVIRFDGKGFRVSDFEEFTRYFKDARKVERIVFEVASIESYSQIIGKNIQLWFDAYDVNKCYICVQDDDRDWADSVFSRLKERLSKYKNYHRLLRNRIVVMAVQVLGVIFGFVGSLWVAHFITPHLNIRMDNLFTLTFIAIFLIFSNIWGHALEIILKILDFLWPNTSFREEKRAWLFQGLSVAFVLFIVAALLKWGMAVIPKIVK